MNRAHTAGALAALRFDNRFTRSLPADPESGPRLRQVRDAIYSRVEPTPAPAPELVAHAWEVAELIGLSEADVASPEFVEVFAGNRLLPGMDPHATCYGGHQFGNWAGQLGDGRAINLGEVVDRDGGHQMLQLKGAGLTPYSRMADGLAVLRSSVREFLCSEAMHHLGVPTTRALSLVRTGLPVLRDMLYDGNAAHEPGAVVCRVAPSFTRFGHFQMLAARQEHELLRRFLDYTIETDFPELLEVADGKERYLAWFTEVSRRTAELMVHWMRVGFVHGVMNTDNLSVLGLTIDYGPYGWLDDYDPDWTPNTTDAAGRRYRYGHQPGIAQWNLLQLAQALMPVIDDAPALEQILRDYESHCGERHRAMMAAKLGLRAFDRERDEELLAGLEEVLRLVETDMTLFFRRLAALTPAQLTAAPEARLELLRDAYYQPEQLTAELWGRIDAWLIEYLQRLQDDGRDDAERRAAMNAVNPKYVLRNYLAQLAIDKAEAGDDSEVVKLLELLRRPYDEQPEHESYAARRPDWARSRVGCSQLSCSS